MGKAPRTNRKNSAVVILGAARACFARHGYHGTSIKIIAAEAGIRSPSILHYHFKSKEDIFLAVMRQTLSGLTEKATLVGLSGEQKLRGMGALEAFFKLIDEEDDLPPLFMECMAMAARGEPSQSEFSELLLSLERMVEDAIWQLLGDNASRLPLSPKALAGTIIDLMTGHAIRATLLDDKETDARRKGILTLLSLLRPMENNTNNEAQTERDPQ
ncbi:MAG: TetR/AcrR family transcriptional regulator [Planctomycetota bacterium]|nr:TetR/AcrR family transcriptional regulator [Planctomycetota bacterium]